MSSSRKRRTRMVVALSAAVLLASALLWTSFGASSEAMSPSALAKTAAGDGSYQLTGKVADGYRREGNTLLFSVKDRDSDVSIPVRYQGTVPDPFRQGREVIVTVHRQGGTWVGERDSLITKCPSKFSAEAPGNH